MPSTLPRFSPSPLLRCIRHLMEGLVLTLAAACGGGDQGDSTAPVAPAAPDVPVATVGPLNRLEVTPAAVVLTSSQQSVTLTVRGFDAKGAEVTGLVPTFESSRITEMAASTSGVVTALSTTGSALINVRVGDVVATPVTALAVRLREGVLAVSDQQVVSGPVRMTPLTTASNAIRLTLQGTPPIKAGTMLMGTGAIPIAGRVLVARPVGGNTEVDLEMTPVTEVVQDMSINLQFSPQQVQLQPDASTVKQPSSIQRRTANSSRKIGAFECKSEVDLTPLTGEFEATLTPPQVGFSVVDKIVAGRRVASETIAQGTLEVKAKAVFRLGATVAGAIDCNIDFGRLTVPVAGLASIVVAPSLPLRFTSQLAGAVSVGAFTFGVEGNLAANLKLGLRLAEGSETLESFKQFDVTQSITRTATFPTDAGVRGKAALFFGLGSGLDLSIGNYGPASLASWNLIKLEAGPEFELKTGTLYDLALDDIYNSEYELKFKLAASPGETIAKAIETFFLSGKAVDLTAKLERPLARSPQASAISVDREQFAQGDLLTFKVTLNPANLQFPGVGYNLKEIRIYQLSHDTPTSANLIATASALTGQSEFTLTWTAPSAGDVLDRLSSRPNFFAYFVDVPFAVLSEVLPFELGRVVPTTRRIEGAGLTWDKPIPVSPLYHRIISVVFASESVAVAVGIECADVEKECPSAIFRSADAGVSWASIKLPSEAGTACVLKRVAFGDSRNGVAWGTNCLLLTSDGGLTWTASGLEGTRRIPSSSMQPGCLAYVAPNTILIVGDQNSTLRSADGGKTWKNGSAGSGNGFNLAFLSTDGKGLVLGSSGENAMWSSTDGGESWASAYLPRYTDNKPISNLANIKYVGGKTFMSGTYGSLLRSIDQGRTWAKVFPIGGRSSDIAFPEAFVDSKTGIATVNRTGVNGLIGWETLRTVDGGLTWSQISYLALTSDLRYQGIGEMVFSSAGVGLMPIVSFIPGVYVGIRRSVPAK